MQNLVIIFYGILTLFSLVTFFVNWPWSSAIKKYLAILHIGSLLLVIVDIILMFAFDRTFRGIATDRIFWASFLLTGSFIFALFRRELSTYKKIYFGFFFFYPLFAALAFLIDRIFFVIVSGPILITLLLPQQYYSDSKYDLRAPVGLMARKAFLLIEKEGLTEKIVGTAEDEYYEDETFTEFTILSRTNDSIISRINVNGKDTSLVFKP